MHPRYFRALDPVEMAFEDLCQRFDRFLTKQNAAGDRNHGLVILDKTTRETSLHNSGDSQYVDIIASRFHEADGVIHGLCHKHSGRDVCMCLSCYSGRQKSDRS